MLSPSPRALLIACASVLLYAHAAACAATTHATARAATPRLDTLYDSAAEWTVFPRAEAPAEPVAEAAGPVPPAPLPELRPFTTTELERIQRVQRAVSNAARSERVPTDLVNGIIWVESRFIVRARGRRGPLGLMQLMPRTGREVALALGRDYAPFDPDFNVRAGTFYFARLLERFHGNLRLSLAAYNIGPAVVDVWIREQQPLPQRSERYIDGVFEAARAFRQRGL